jgi:guanylate kinase
VRKWFFFDKLFFIKLCSIFCMVKIFVFSGFSGAGKGTIIYEILKSIPNTKKLPNSTSRKKRKDDLGDKNYFSKKEFESMIKNNELIEYDFHFGNYYGTRKKDLADLLKDKKIVLLELDVIGTINFKKQYPKIKTIFILPPSIKTLKKRLNKRGKMSKEQFILRSERMLKELSYIDKYDYIIVNDDLKKAVSEVKSIIENEAKI